MLRFIATSVVLLAVGSVLGVPAPVTAAPPDPPKPPTVDEFLRTAIVSGLEEDGVPLALAADLAKRQDFIGKCSICKPSQKALADYSDRRVQPVAKAGKGLPEELVTRLKSDKAEVRQTALRELVGRYTERGYATSQLTTDQKTALQKELDQMRKDGAACSRAGRSSAPPATARVGST